MTKELARIVARGRTRRAASERAMAAFKAPHEPDEGEDLARKIASEKKEAKRRKKAKRAFKKR
jgi:hypothetical protein